MSFEPAITDQDSKPFRWWFLPSWLGLDAPCVVLTWTWATSRSSDVALAIRPAAALFLVVWSIYLTDRLIDVARCRDWTHATGRLRFGRDWRLLFWACLGLCITGILAILWAGLPVEVIGRAAAVALGVGLHFLAFVIPVFLREKLYGKEFGVGLFFALGAYSCLGATRQSLPLFGSIAIVVAFNCLVIAARDASSDRANDPGGASRWWQTMNRDLLWIGVALSLAAILAASLARPTAFYLSVAAALSLLTVLHRFAYRLNGDAFRALADFALFTPIPVIGVMIWISGDAG
jgi:hypothetical protein